MSEERIKTVTLNFTDTWETLITLPKELYEKEYKEKVESNYENDAVLSELIKDMTEESEEHLNCYTETFMHDNPTFHGERD